MPTCTTLRQSCETLSTTKHPAKYHFTIRNMPFVIRPPLDTAAANNPSLIYTIIEPDTSERSILQDLQAWDWRVTQYDFGDEDYTNALTQIERDIKKRRRQSYAIAGELHGYNKRPTLEEVWEFEAERMLEEAAYVERKDPRRTPIIEYDDECESRSQNAEMYVSDHLALLITLLLLTYQRTWLHAIDRTRQTNGFLEYTDPEGAYPKLVTRGLDHNYLNASLESVIHKPNCSQRALSHISNSTRIAKHMMRQRERSLRDILPSLTDLLVADPTSIGHNATFLPFIFQFPARHFEETPFAQRQQQQQRTTRTPPANPFPQNPDNTSNPYPQSSPPSPTTSAPSQTLIFPHHLLSETDYIHQTRRGIKRSTSCPSHPTEAAGNPYGWKEWDRRIMRKKDVKAHVKFFVRREGRRLGECGENKRVWRVVNNSRLVE
jgi:hypothetical protein